MARSEAAGAVGSVWARTLASYKKDLSRKDLHIVEGITSPTDIANHIKDLEAKTHAGKSGAFADRVHDITSRLTQFSNVIGAVTSSNTEASLIWGSLKLLLTIVHQSSEEYRKICQSILAVSESFPIVELVTETFNHSELVCGPVAEFYTCVLRFWSKALKFYKRRRLFNTFRAWHDFDSEFGDLDGDMKRYGGVIEKAAATVHMNESRAARLEQKAFNSELLEAQRSAVTSNHHRDIVKWLAPFNHEAGYFVDDLRSAFESRHPNTCMWILDRPEFDTWIESGPNDAITRMLWLTGIPGAGKTVLSSFVINRCFEVSGKQSSTSTLYFFFKRTDSDKNSILAVTRSLIYQLYSLFPTSLCADIVSLRDESGKEKALSDQRLWDLFVKHATDLQNLIIVLDALDECDDVDLLLQRMIPFLERCNARILVVSRREENITLSLEGYPCVDIGQEDIDADIHSYVTSEIEKIPRFQGKSVQRRMISALASGHGGMFLWAYLMVKELKELGTIRQVDEALKALPTGLKEMHEAIITRLDSTLHKAHRELATKILTWIVCAVRPLRLAELQEILRFEIRQGRTADHLQVDDDDDLLYSEKDIELACGALVTSRNETLQLIHLSTKEILTQRPHYMLSDDSRLAFYIDSQRDNPRMATLCVSYISTHLNGIDSVTRPNLETVSRLQLSKESFDSTELVTKSPFMDYASISWQAHLIDGKISLELESVMRCLQVLFTYDLTILWIELCILLHDDIIWTLERNCKELMSWADYTLVPAESSCHQAIGFLWAWSSAVVSIINEYGPFIEEHPCEIHYLDLENVLSNECAPNSAALPPSFASTQGRTVREQISVIRAVDKFQPKIKIEPCRQLQSNLQDPVLNFKLGFVLYDSTRDVYFSAEYLVTNDTEVLRVQDRTHGRRLQPMKSTLNVLNVSCKGLVLSYPRIITAILSPDRTYLAILYSDGYGYFVTSIWSIERHLDFLDIRNRRPWARRLHCLGSINSLFLASCLPLTVGQDSFFYSPSGKIHPERGIHKRIPDSLISTTITETDWPTYPSVILAFAGNGQTLIKLDRSVGLVEKVSWLEDTITEPLHSSLPGSNWQMHRACLRAISQTATFMVYDIPHEDQSTALLYLLDTRGYREQLRVNPSMSCGSMTFYFYKDEKYLLSIDGVVKEDHKRFLRWTISEPGFFPQEERELFIPNTRSNGTGYISVGEDGSMVVLVDQDRELYEIDLERLKFKDGTLTTSRGSTVQHQPYCQRDYLVSSDGLRVVGIYIECPACSDTTKCDHEEMQPVSPGFRKTRIELTFVELSRATDQTRTIELEYSDPNSSTSHEYHSTTFSPDLSLLQAGPHIFDLLAPRHPQLSFPEFPPNYTRREKASCMSFSSCNGYMITIEGKDPRAEGEKATFGLFRICRTGGRIERILIADLEGLAADLILAAFHPTLPLLVLTCHTYGGSNMKDIVRAMKVREIDLQALKSIPITLPRLGSIKPKKTSRYDCQFVRAQFSQCGSSCFLEFRDTGVAILNSVLLEKMQAKIQIPAVWRSDTSYNGRFYQFGSHPGSTMIRLYQSIDRLHRNGLRDPIHVWRKAEQTIAVNVSAFPSHIFSARMYLITGEKGDDPVQILFLPYKGPPEIKYLRVTLNQILAKLEEAAKAVEPNIDKLFREEDEVSEEESGGLESEGAAMSADEDGSGNEETD